MVTGFRGWYSQKNMLGARVTEKPGEERPKPLLSLTPTPYPCPTTNPQELRREALLDEGQTHQPVLHTGVLGPVADKAGGLVFRGGACHHCPLKGSSVCPIPLPMVA